MVEDKVHGAIAKINVTPGEHASAKAIENKVADLLSRYTVRYELTVR